ncbi:MAG: pyruvate kinase, partial [Gemmatimonadetes bacterium]|nr:pyruvate kinase [Gemmatimonadota bacterium]
VDAETITARILVGGPLTSHKGINLPNTPIKAPILSRKDRADLLFGLSQGVDYVAVSFVRNPDDIREVRSFLKHEVGNPKPVPLIAKIEKYEALDCFSEILESVEGIMVARGDLGVEIPVEQVPRRQKRIIEETNWAGKPVITATQMLKSMVEQPRPTRAEVSDVANAILDGSNGIMLSEETAAGRYPVESVKMMSKIARDIETIFPFNAWKHHYTAGGRLSPEEAVAKASCEMAESIDAGAIITCTLSGSTTHLIAKYRPRRPIIAATPDPHTYRRLALVWGCIPRAIQNRNVDDVEEESIALALQQKLLKKGDRVVITAGLPLDMPGTTNLIKVSVA